MEKVCYLVMVTENNNNKYYRMTANGDTFLAEWGRIGNEKSQSKLFPISQWNAKKQGKIKKGYVDQTALVAVDAGTTNNTDPFVYIANPNIKKLITFLYKNTRDYLSSNYSQLADTVTEAQLQEANYYLEQLQKVMNDVNKQKLEDINYIQNINEILLSLYRVIPRKMKKVNLHLVEPGKSTKFVKGLIEHETEVFNTLASALAAMTTNTKDSKPQVQKDMLTELGYYMEEANEKETAFVKKRMGRTGDRIHKVYVVTAPEQEQRVKNWMQQQGLTDKDLVYHFHGSRTENWFNILKTGLTCTPKNVKKTGSMLGQGIYFGPSSAKSLNYTSLSGSYWTGGSDNVGYMALYAIAAKNTYHTGGGCKDRLTGSDLCRKMKAKGYDSLYAHADSGYLRADEMVVYNDEASFIKYLIELK